MKTALVEPLEPIQGMLKVKFSKLKLHGELVATRDALTTDDIKDIFSVLDIFRYEDNTPISSFEDAKHLLEKLEQFRTNAEPVILVIRYETVFLIYNQSFQKIDFFLFECMRFIKDFSFFR